MTAWGYEFYLLVLKVFLTRSLRSLVTEILSALEDKIRIPARPCNILYFYSIGPSFNIEVQLYIYFRSLLGVWRTAIFLH